MYIYNSHKFMYTYLVNVLIEINVHMYYTILVRQGCKISYRKE